MKSLIDFKGFRVYNHKKVKDFMRNNKVSMRKEYCKTDNYNTPSEDYKNIRT